MKKPKQDIGLYPFRLFGRVKNPRLKNGRLIGERMSGIEDLTMGREWEWRESDLPGLRAFLRELLANWHPYANNGLKFKEGRKQGSFGPVHKAIERVLKKTPDLPPRKVWEALKAEPPRGLKFLDNRAGEYIEHAKGETSRARFNNTVREVKSHLAN